MLTAHILLLLFDGDGEASGPQGFLCVHSVTIRSGLICSASVNPGMEGTAIIRQGLLCGAASIVGMEGDASINPGLSGSVEANQCQ